MGASSGKAKKEEDYQMEDSELRAVNKFELLIRGRINLPEIEHTSRFMSDRLRVEGVKIQEDRDKAFYDLFASYSNFFSRRIPSEKLGQIVAHQKEFCSKLVEDLIQNDNASKSAHLLKKAVKNAFGFKSLFEVVEEVRGKEEAKEIFSSRPITCEDLRIPAIDVAVEEAPSSAVSLLPEANLRTPLLPKDRSAKK